MKELRECPAEMGNPINDDQFSAYIHASLTPDYRPLLTSIMASTRTSGRTLSLHDLITFIYEEADNKAAEKNVDKAKDNAAMAANKEKGKSKSKSDKYCNNCKKKGHMKENCFVKGGGKEGEAPDWWKKKFGKDESKTSFSIVVNLAIHLRTLRLQLRRYSIVTSTTLVPYLDS
jgi:hypothetical protein